MINVAFPSININILTILKQIASYDILESYSIWTTSYFSFLKFDNFRVPFINQQMQIISYNGTNAYMGLGSVTIYIFIYFLNVLFVLVLKLYIKMTGGKYGGHWLLEKII
jgi:hypothetical protein